MSTPKTARERAQEVVAVWRTKHLSQLLLKKSEVDALTGLIERAMTNYAQMATVNRVVANATFPDGQEFKFGVKRAGGDMEMWRIE